MTNVFRAMVRPAQLLLLCGSMALALPGCGNSSKPKAAPEQPPAEANAEEKAEAPAEQPRGKLGKKAPVEEKPAAPAPVARHRPDDPTKWQLADLKSGLAAHDLRFVPAVMVFSVQNQGSKRAKELQDLLVGAAQMKDDPSITLPLPPQPTATPVTAAKPAPPTAPATPPAGAPTPNAAKRMPRFGRGRAAGSQ
jgi:hypothetical protein